MRIERVRIDPVRPVEPNDALEQTGPDTEGGQKDGSEDRDGGREPEPRNPGRPS